MLLTSILLASSALYLGHSLPKLQKKYQHKRKRATAKQGTALTPQVNKPPVLSQEDKRDQHYLYTSLGCVGLSGAAIFYPALGIVCVAGLSYVSLPFFKQAYQSLVKEKRIRISAVDSALAILCIAQGYYLAWSAICSLIYGGRRLLKRTEDSSRQSLLNIFDQQTDKAWLLINGAEIETPLNQLQHGDIIVIHAGETLAIDGVIQYGNASVDQHLLTGEAQPAEMGIGDTVLASSIVLTGTIHVEVTQTGQETAASRIAEVLAQTADYKSSIQSRGEMYSDKAALPTLVLSGLALASVGVTAGIAVLNAAFAFYMRVLGPIGMLNYLKQAFNSGILIKDGRVLDLLPKVDTIVFDKTGTLTHTQPHVGNIHTYSSYSADEVLQFAAAAEYKQTHPIALAILQEARLRQLELPALDHAEYQIGHGLSVQINGQLIQVGSMRFFEQEQIALPDEIHHTQQLSHSLVLLAIEGNLVGAIELLPTIREEAHSVIEHLQQQGMSTAIISGDHQAPTRKMAETLGIDTYYAETLPEQKAELIQQLKDEGRFVCYIGDGINDSIALKTAQVSISFSNASNVATDTAQVILMNDDLQQIIHLFELAQSFDQQMQKTLLYSIAPGVVTVTGAFFLHFGLLHSVIFNQLGFVSGLKTITKTSATTTDTPQLKQDATEETPRGLK